LTRSRSCPLFLDAQPAQTQNYSLAGKFDKAKGSAHNLIGLQQIKAKCELAGKRVRRRRAKAKASV
jgi:hypothetical protein